MSTTENTVSLENPTWEFLHSNFRKAELQKHCRDIGITKVWVTKEKLIDMIIEKSRSSRPNVSGSTAENREISPREAMKGVEELRERINIRGMEIEEFHELLKAAHVTINKLNDCLSSLEEQVKQLQNTDTTQQPLPTCQEALSTHSQPQGTLLLGGSS